MRTLSRLLALLLLAAAPSACSSQDAAPGPTDAAAGIIRCGRSLASVCGSDGEEAGPGASDASDLSSPTPTVFGFQGCPPELPSALPTAWCGANPGAGAVTGSCAGYTALPVYAGTGEYDLFLYPADGGALAAILAAGNSHYSGCVAGSQDFELPLSCFGDQGLELLDAFTGPGALPGCSAYDSGSPDVAPLDASPDASHVDASLEPPGDGD